MSDLSIVHAKQIMQDMIEYLLGNYALIEAYPLRCYISTVFLPSFAHYPDAVDISAIFHLVELVSLQECRWMIGPLMIEREAGTYSWTQFSTNPQHIIVGCHSCRAFQRVPGDQQKIATRRLGKNKPEALGSTAATSRGPNLEAKVGKFE